ncbi:helix-turn-helix transcriptional regulator [Haloarchaeobius amylolyticus]|uniref:helix-turn-helix transcriptional regulator n=1 Tax=Haloarchaeobius amylolyticus TaxID=1198296 RepID=UPI00226E110A|nr:winged helix-turn-helix domain-containing protein [Haloarchaeobius amylolyticus]
MGEQRSAIEEISFVARSTNRVRILETVHDLDGATREDLRTELSVARTTVTRNVETLLEKGWLQQENGEYTVTPGGEAVIERFLDLEETVRTALRLQPFLQWTTREEFDLDLTHLQDASVTVAAPGNPWAMVNEHVARLRESSDDRVALPLTGLHAVEAVHRKVVDGDATVEMIVAEGVAETLFEDDDFAPLTRDLLDSDGFELYLTDAALPFYLGILDETVQVGVDEEGEPRALLETTDDGAREWARERLDVYRREATPLEAWPATERS